MDEITRHFIATSARLAYLNHYEHDEQSSESERDDTDHHCSDSVSAYHEANMNQSNRRKGEDKDAIETYLEEFEDKLKRSLHTPTFILELAGALILLIYTVFTGFMYFANRDAANAAQSAAETAKGTLQEIQTTTQPWVGLDKNAIDIEESPVWGLTSEHKTDITYSQPIVIPPHSFKDIEVTPVYVTASYTIKNFGPLPALRENDALEAVADTGPIRGIVPTETFELACRGAEQSTTGDGGKRPATGAIILPGESVPITKSANVLIPKGVTDIERIWFFVCTVYEDPRGNRLHHAKYWFMSAFKEKPPNPAHRVPLPNSPGYTYVPLRRAEIWGAEED